MSPKRAAAQLRLALQPEADALLSKDPLALLIGMLLDQQVPMEKAFVGPYVLTQRMGKVTARGIVEAGEDRLVELFVEKPAIHRFPAAMARRVVALAEQLVADYDGEAANVWKGVDTGAELLARVRKLPGFGDAKARIFVALLGKQLGVQPKGWREAAGDYGVEGAMKSVADIVDDDSLAEVRSYKKEMKAAAKASK
ncbi:HhH-GPD-type base excision DNA repair protein [Fodinicola acaciae]|uniref:HhH-GPD-type base excision DNA repair protein n=1 Tax=Fodinicola acaciae TaxID=2681555 RepID=UPI001C9E81BB|nr:HhH-GPD-type base excision DNA repair protein [Fodinicola acaciae]